jgi:ABC-type glycerol-3-phosphate transport system permease component
MSQDPSPLALWMMGVCGGDAPRAPVAPGRAASDAPCFVLPWNEPVAAMRLSMPRAATAPLAIARVAQAFGIRYVTVAAASLAAIPAALPLLRAQRRIMRGRTPVAARWVSR